MALNPFPSDLDPGQIIKRAFDGLNDRVRVDAAISVSGASVEISDTDDSIKLGDGTGTNFVSVTTVGPKNGLDINILNDIGIDSIPIPVVTDMINATVNLSTEILAKVGGSNKTNRVLLYLVPLDGDIHFRLTSGGTTLDSPRIVRGTPIEFNISDAVNVYIFANSGTVKTYIAEGSG